VIKFVATRCLVSTLKCTKSSFALYTTGDPPAGFKGLVLREEGKGMGKGRERKEGVACGMGRSRGRGDTQWVLLVKCWIEQC